MRGVDLGEMVASDFFDVLHVLHEQDSIGTYEDRMMKSRYRTIVFENLYNETYQYKIREEEARSTVPQTAHDSEDSLLPPDLPAGAHPQKPPAQPPTPMSADPMRPFGDILDSPVG